MSTTVKWYGHACVTLEFEGKTVIIDPWLDNPKAPEEKPEKVDLILVTHGHNDHFGNTLELAREHKATIVCIHEMSVFIQNKLGDFGGSVVGMNFGGTYDFNGIKVSMVPSSHSGGFADDDGMHYLGAAGGFVIKFPDGNSFYHCGDTGVTREMEITKDLFSPKYGLLAIGGHYTMDPKGAAYAARMLSLKAVIPIHWGTFVPPLNGTPDSLRENLHGSGIEVHELSPGGSMTFE